MEFATALDNKLLEKKLEIAKQEFAEAQEEYRKAIEQKNRDVEAYDHRNKELEKWCAETQDRFERETVSKKDLDEKLAQLRDDYWTEARTNYEKLDQRLQDYEGARQHIARLQEEIDQQKKEIEQQQLALKRTQESEEERRRDRDERRREKDKHIEALIDARVQHAVHPRPQRLKYEDLLTKLRDDTPLFPRGG